MVRAIVILGIMAGCAFMAGWFTIQRDDEQTTIRFNRDEIREDASKAIAKGRELLNQDGTSQGVGNQFSQQAQDQLPALQGVFQQLGNEASNLSDGQAQYPTQQAQYPTQQAQYPTQQATLPASSWGQPPQNYSAPTAQQY